MKKYPIYLIIFLCSIYAQTGDPYANVNYDSVEIGILDMNRNCGALFVMNAQLNDSIFTITATDTGGLTLCGNCYFDVSITVGGLDPGNYSANIYSYDIYDWDAALETWIRDTTFIGNVTFSIIETNIDTFNILSSYQSPCTPAQSTSEETHPMEYILLNNHPNPFNNSTRIEFYLPTNEFIDISVYNVMGQKVSTLKQDFYSAGYHTINWNASQNPSGLFFILISTRTTTISKKVLYIK